MPIDTHMLKPIADCPRCGAKKFEHEPRGFCCRSGKVELNALDIPDVMIRLWSSADADARHFRNNISFSMAISLSLLYTVALIALLQA
jgi:hypothetical protein